MPLCSECGNERPRVDYSKAQLKKSAKERRCNHCIQAELLQEEHQDGSRDHSIAPTATNRSLVALLVEEVVPILLQRGIPRLSSHDISTSNTTSNTSNSTKLRRRLLQVFQQDSMLWLSIPFLEGLLYAGDMINRRVFVPGSNEPFPLLMCVCQFKLFKKQFQYKGDNDMVAWALRAGAIVNETLANGCSALFFAVKYGNHETIQLLVHAGADTHMHDIYGQSAWKNAVEYANPAIIQALIQLGVSVDEKIETTGRDAATAGRQYQTIPDFMLHQFISTSSGSPSGDPFSWFLFGIPTLEDYAVSLIRLLQAGAHFSTIDMGLSVCVHAASPQISQKMEHKKRQLLILLGRVLFGDLLPVAIAKEAQQYTPPPASQSHKHHHRISQNAHPSDSPPVCKLCNHVMGDRDRPITLYCGHAFCLQCIQHDIQQLSTSTSTSRSQSSHPSSKNKPRTTCPECHRRLARDILMPSIREAQPPSHLLGIDHRNEEESSEPRGPWVLSDKQLDLECHARGIIETDLSREERLEEIESEPKLSLSHLLELSATQSFEIDGRQYLAPKAGPVVIPIRVKGVPILAWLSPTSPLTVLSKDFVDAFGLERKSLSSQEFVQYDGSELEPFWAVGEFSFLLDSTIGDSVGDSIEIRLNNAICYQFDESDSSSNDRPRGVQLGMDFFDSASWTQVTCLLDNELFEDDQDENNPNKPDTEDEDMYAIADGCGPIVGKEGILISVC